MSNIPEILAPCGSYDILKAAVLAGADACYIGGSRFGARAYAENLGADSVLEAIDYCHLHGVSLYLTVNTLFKESEISAVYDYLLPYYTAGLDAVIVQDLGAFSVIKKCFPDLNIHCSTQMNINSRHAASYMKELGATRVVTAREMPLEEIRRIKDSVDIEIETFVHGAMCYSYSGQCLMSSLAGGRSGNRGRCAQPCRKCYNGRYLLSMKDMCAITRIPELAEAGIDSFKIEGRMKNAYYVASAVDAYKNMRDEYLRGSFDIRRAAKYREKLANIYNRGGFSEGYFFMHNGPEMISIDRPNNMGVRLGCIKDVAAGKVQLELSDDLYKQDVLELSLKNAKTLEITSGISAKKGSCVWLNAPKTKKIIRNSQVYRTRCNKLIEDIEKNIIDAEPQRIAAKAFVRLHEGEGMLLRLSAEHAGATYSVEKESEYIIERAGKKPVSKEQIIDKVVNSGDENVRLSIEAADIDENIFIPLGEIKRLRREAIGALAAEICEAYRRAVPDRYESPEACNLSMTHVDKELRVAVSDEKQLRAVLKYSHVKGIIISCSLYQKIKATDMYAYILDKGVRIYIRLPYIITSVGISSYEIYGDDVSGYYIYNIDAFAVLKKEIKARGCLDKELVAGFSLYAYNSAAVDFFKKEFDGITFELPAELKLSELEQVQGAAYQALLYGRQRVMLSAQCIKKTTSGCSHNNEIIRLNDDMNNTFYAQCLCDECCNVIYNGRPFNAMGKLKNGLYDAIKVVSYLINFTNEVESVVDDVMKQYEAVVCFGKEYNMAEGCTYGHLFRGVE